MDKILTVERLNQYSENVKELDFLIRKRELLKKRLDGIQSIDFERTRVTSGNGRKTSPQEHYAISLEQINKRIDECTKYLASEHSLIKEKISAIAKWQYRKLLVYRYLEKLKWSEIIADFFEYEEDFEEEKDFKYKERILYWHRKALKELTK